MSEDFVTQLRLQLRQAAEREARRGPARRMAREAAARQLWRPALVLAAVLLVAAAVLGVARDLRPSHTTTPAGRGLHLLLRTPLVGQGGAVHAGFGSLWAADASTGDLLRVDPRTRAVRARIHVGGEAPFDVGAGAVWTLAGQRLLRIDPGSDRVAARIALPRPAQGLIVAGDTVWVGTNVELQVVDARRNALIRTIRVARGGYQIDGVATDARRLYVSRADGTLLVYDARTGARRPSPGVEVHGAVAAADGVVFTAGDRDVAALDVRTARTRWTSELRVRSINYVALAGGALWVEGVGRDTHRDVLWRLDPRSGRVTGSLRLPEFGASGMASIAGRLWLVSTKGVVQIIG